MPSNVSYFEKLLYAATVLSVIAVYLTYDIMLAQMGDVPAKFLWIGMAGSLVIWLILIVLTARLGMNWARWVITVWIVLSAMSSISIISDTLAVGTMLGMISGSLQIITLLMEVAAVYLVFTGDAPAWFGR